MCLTEFAITGAGIISSIGLNKSDHWVSLLQGRSNFVPTALFGVDKECPLVGKIALTPESSAFLSPRIQRKIDRFTLLAFIAYHEASEQAKLTKDNHTGLIIGNTFGGWSFVEPQMYDLYHVSYDTLSPYVATAWFPTAPQGEISILSGLKGYSKTISADFLSVGYGLMHACDLIQEGLLESCFVGGVEAPLTALVYNACSRLDLIPSTRRSSGYYLSEGAGMFAMESAHHARKRNAKILGYVKGLAFGDSFLEVMEQCIEESSLNPDDIQGILLDSKNIPDKDQEERESIDKVFRNSIDSLSLCSPKSTYGNVFSADIAFQIIHALMALENNVLPGIQNSKTTKRVLNRILINASDVHGKKFSLIIGKS